jgi:hypothetical protein
MDEETLAQRMFAAYNVAAGGLTWDGKPIPPWEATGPKVQANWRAAAREAIAFVSKALLSCFVPAVYDWQFIGAFEDLYPDEVLPTVLVCDGQEWAALDAQLRAVERDVNTLEGSVYVREGAPGKPSTWRLRPA